MDWGTGWLVSLESKQVAPNVSTKKYKCQFKKIPVSWLEIWTWLRAFRQGNEARNFTIRYADSNLVPLFSLVPNPYSPKWSPQVSREAVSCWGRVVVWHWVVLKSKTRAWERFSNHHLCSAPPLTCCGGGPLSGHFSVHRIKRNASQWHTHLPSPPPRTSGTPGCIQQEK